MTEKLLQQQLESPSGTGRVEPEVRSDWQNPQQQTGRFSQHRQSHWQIWTDSAVYARQSRYCATSGSDAATRLSNVAAAG